METRPRIDSRIDADVVDLQVRRRRERRRDLLLVSVPAVFGVLILVGYRWYDHYIKQVTNRELVALVIRTFADGMGHNEPLPVGVDRRVARDDLILFEQDVFRLSRLLNTAPNLLDPWGMPLRARRGVDWLEIRSAAEDGVMDTPDDVFAVRPDTPRAPATTTPRSSDRGVSGEP